MGSADEVGVVILVTAGLVVLVESLGEPADWGPPPPCGFSSPLAWACCPHTWWWFSQSLCWQNGPQYRATLQPLHVSVAFRPQFQQLYGKNNEYPHKHQSRFQRPRLFRSTPRIETSGPNQESQRLLSQRMFRNHLFWTCPHAHNHTAIRIFKFRFDIAQVETTGISDV